MYIIKADGVVIYNPASDGSATKVLEPRAKFKLNKAGSLEFTMLPGNVMYGRLQRMKSVVTLEQDGKIIFQGRVLDTVTDINRHINVYCEGALGYLMDSAVRPYTYEGGATGLFYQLVAQHNAQVDGFKQFSVGSVTAAGGETLEEYDSDSCANTLNEIRQMLVDPYGGYLRVRYSGGSKYLDYIDAYGTSSGQTLEYGVNMVAMEDAYELGNIYSVLVPLGAYYTEEDKKEEEEGGEEEPATVSEGEETEGETPEEEVDETIGEDGLKKKLKIAGVVTIEKVNGGSDYLIDSDMLSKYGRVVKAHRWENVDDPQELMNKGYEMLERNKDARSIKLRAVDLHVINASVDTIELGDSVRLVSNPHGLSLTDICSAIDLDIEYPEYTEYTFGIAPDTLTEQNASASRRASYQSSSFLRWLTETDTSLNIAVQNVDLINGKLTQVGIDVDALEGAVTIWADQIDNLVTQTAELKVKYDEITATVQNNSGQIAQLRLDVDSITAQVEDATGQLSQLRLDVNSITARVQNNEGDISQLKIDIDSITAKVEDAEGKIAALELSLTDLEAKVVLKAQYDEDKNAMLKLISNAEESIATLAAQHGDRLAALELYTSDLESRVLLKAEYEANRKADLQLIANAEESIATLEAEHDGRIASLELKTNDLESSVLLKAEYEENREADLKLISNAQESVATLETKYDGQIASLTLRADEQGSLIAAKADRIDLEGYVTMDKFEALESYVEDMMGDSLSVTTITAGSGDFDSLWCGTLNGGTAATQEWVEEQGFLKSADGVEGSIATQEWVKDQGYATQAWVNNKDYVLNSSLPSILISYATKNWVTEQGYLKSIPSTYATQSWVQNQGYLKSVPSNYATQAWVLSQDYAAKSWVEGKGYLTEIPSGYATQDWVAENFSKASATYKPTAIERYGSVSGTSIPVRALNAGGTVLLTGTVDAGDVYEAGEDSVTLSAGEWASNKMTVTASNGKTLEVDASSIYNAGANAGFNGGYNMAITGALIELDGSTVKVYSPDGGIAGPTLDISSNLTASYNSGYSDATPVHASRVASYNAADNEYALQVTVLSDDGTRHVFDMTEIDASAAYDAGYAAGYQAAKDAATVEAGVSWSNPAQNYAMVRYWASAKIDGEEVAYTSASESKNISGYV